MPMHREWVDLGFSDLEIPTGGSITPLDVLFDMREEVNKTVVRLIVGLDLVHENTDVNEVAKARIDMGIGVATREGFDGGQLTIPSPAITKEFPIHGWLWRATYGVQFANSATFGVEVYRFPRIDLDLRASRKVDKGVLYLAAVNFAQQGAMDVDMTGMVRALMLTG